MVINGDNMKVTKVETKKPVMRDGRIEYETEVEVIDQQEATNQEQQ